jgi:hypothetical protein
MQLIGALPLLHRPGRPRPTIERGHEMSELTRQSSPEAGERYRNVFTGRIDTVKHVGPCDVLKGAVRVWLVDEEKQAASNGWALDRFLKRWEYVNG